MRAKRVLPAPFRVPTVISVTTVRIIRVDFIILFIFYSNVLPLLRVKNIGGNSTGQKYLSILNYAYLSNTVPVKHCR